MKTNLCFLLIFGSIELCAINLDSLSASVLYAKADTFLLFNKHDSSLRYFRQAEKEYKVLGDWERFISTRNKISEILSAQFKLKEAMNIARECLNLAKEKLGETSLMEADALNNIGNIYYLTGQHEKALEEFDKALKIVESVPHDELHLYAAPTNLGIGNVYYGRHQYAEAFRYFKTALEANSQILGDRHPYVANSYLSLGNLYRNKGSYNLAKENYNTALEILLDFFGESHPEVATTYVGIGDIYKSAGAYELALQYYNQGLLIYKEFLNPLNPKFGDVYLGIADVYKNQGYYAEAMIMYQQALDLYKKTIGENHQNSVRSYLGIGNTFVYKEDFREALDFYNKVLEVNFNLVGENHVNTSAAYNNLASIYYFSGDFDLAERYFQKALKIDLAIHGHEHPNVANAFYNIGRVQGEKGETQKALESVQEAINSSIIDFENENIFVNPALVNFFDTKDLLWYLKYKGELLESGFKVSANMKGMDIALNSFILSDSLVEKIRQSYTDRNDQIQLGTLANRIYESAVGASHSILEMLDEENVKMISPEADYGSKLKEYQDRFFFFTEKNKGAILFASIAEANAKSFGGIPDSTLLREKELKIKINQYTQELAANDDSVQRAFYQQELFKANRAYENLVANMEKDFPKYYELKYDYSVAPLEEIQKTLSDSTMMVTYFVTDDHMYVSYITNSTFEIFKNRKRSKYHKWLNAFRKGIIYQSDPIYRKYGTLLYDQLFPEAIPKKYKKLIIVQDGLMSTIPFEALPTQEVHDTLQIQDYPFLIKEFEVSYAYSANLLHKTFYNEKIVRPKAKNDLLAFAPVEFEDGLVAKLKQIKKESYEEEQIAKSARRATTLYGLPALPGTKLEVDSILSAYANRNAVSLMEAEATEKNIKEFDLKDYKYVHIATHGFVNQEEPIFSGLFLKTDSTNLEDGILFSGEIYAMDLNAELVTLSACETGLGKISKGEGIIGLSRALTYAGAKNIVVSLWKVVDESTKDLMISFYSDFSTKPVPSQLNQSLSYSQALRKAKLSLIENGRFAHPYYWSPFILIGK